MTALHLIAPPAGSFLPAAAHTEAACVLLAAHVHACARPHAARAQDEHPCAQPHAASAQPEHARARIACLGPRAAVRTLAAFGLHTDHTLLPRRGRPETTARALARLIERERPSEVHCWGVPALRALLKSRPPKGLRLCAHLDAAPDRPFNPKSIATLEAVEVYAESDADAWSAAGVREHHLSLGHLTTPPPLDTRANLRAALGIHPDAVVLAPPADPAASLDARRFAFRVGFVELLNQQSVALIPAGARRLSAARRFRAAASLRFRLLIVEAPLAACLPACDALVAIEASPGHPAPPAGAAAVLRSLAASCGVPIAAPRGDREATVVSRHMAESMSPLLEMLSAEREPAA